MRIKKNYLKDKLMIGSALLAVLLGIILTSLWFFVFNIDRSPVVSIDIVAIGNIIIAFFVARRVPLAGAMLIGMSILLILLGFALLKGFLLGQSV